MTLNNMRITILFSIFFLSVQYANVLNPLIAYQNFQTEITQQKHEQLSMMGIFVNQVQSDATSVEIPSVESKKYFSSVEEDTSDLSVLKDARGPPGRRLLLFAGSA